MRVVFVCVNEKWGHIWRFFFCPGITIDRYIMERKGKERKRTASSISLVFLERPSYSAQSPGGT